MSNIKWIDTQNIAAYMGAPLSLAGAAEFLLGDSEADQKDKEGSKIMHKICTPSNKKKGTFSKYTEDDFKKLIDYCEQDVHVSRQLYLKYKEYIPEYEWTIMQETIDMNHHGIPVDLDLVDAMEDYYQEACQECEVPVGYQLTDVRRTAFMVKTLNEMGCAIPDMKAESVDHVLGTDIVPSMEQIMGEEVWANEDARLLLDTKKIWTMASVKKLKKIKQSCAGQPWLRNGFQYHGAKTGRYAGRGAQPQNFPRGFKKDSDIIEARKEMKV